MESSSVLSDWGLTLAEKLGQGSYATVYKAFRRTLRPNGTREVLAVKCIQKSKICVTQTAQNNVIAEIEILKKLDHPHIVKLIDFLWDKDNIYLITEFCNAGDLSQFIKKRSLCETTSSKGRTLFSLPEPLTRKFLQQLAAAFKYLRFKQISHMDLKPQNILMSISLDKQISLKLADFGFATKLRYGDKATSLRGSPLYMAPEILKERSYDMRVDLWSIGVILYECLFGRPPFSSDSLNGLIDRIIGEEPVVIPSKPPLSPCCRDLLNKLLQKDPDARLTFYEFFYHPFLDESYCPRQEAFEEATKLLSKAEAKHKSSCPLEAFKLYCQSLDCFVTSLQYVGPDRHGERTELRSIIKDVLAKAEAVKVTLNLQLAAEATRGDVAEKSWETEERLLLSLWSDTPQIEAAFVLRNFAENLCSKGCQKSYNSTEDDIQTALQKYELCVESLLKVYQNSTGLPEQPSDIEKQQLRLKMLKKFIGLCLTRAEQIKEFLELKKLNFSAASLEEKERQAETTVEDKTKTILDENYCRQQ